MNVYVSGIMKIALYKTSILLSAWFAVFVSCVFFCCARAVSGELPTATACATGADGGALIAGYKTIDLTSEGAWLQKLDASGKQVWENLAAAEGEDLFISAIKAVDGGYAAAANTFGPKAVVIMFNDRGDISWLRTVEQPGQRVILRSLIVLLDGGYIAAGTLLVRLDSKGKILWKKTFDGTANAIAPADSGGFVVAGETRAADYTLSGLPRTDRDIVAQKFNAKGDAVWRKTFGGRFDDYAAALAVMPDGGIMIAGAMSFGKDSEIFVKKLAKDGNEVWEKTYGGGAGDFATGIEKGDKGEFFVTAAVGSSGAAAAGSMMLLKLDASGKVLWRLALGKSGQANTPACETQVSGGLLIAENRTSLGKTAPVVLRVSRDGAVTRARAYGDNSLKPADVDSVKFDGVRFAASSGRGMDRIVRETDCGAKDGPDACAADVRLSLVGLADIMNWGHKQAILEAASCGGAGACSTPTYYVADMIASELYVIGNTNPAMRNISAGGRKVSGEIQKCGLSKNTLNCIAVLIDEKGRRSIENISIRGSGPELKAKTAGAAPKKISAGGIGLSDMAADFCDRIKRDPESIAALAAAEFTYYAVPRAGAGAPPSVAPDEAALSEMQGAISVETARMGADSCSVATLARIPCGDLIDSMAGASAQGPAGFDARGIAAAFDAMSPSECGAFTAKLGRKNGSESTVEVNSVFIDGQWKILYPFSGGF